MVGCGMCSVRNRSRAYKNIYLVLAKLLKHEIWEKIPPTPKLWITIEETPTGTPVIKGTRRGLDAMMMTDTEEMSVEDAMTVVDTNTDESSGQDRQMAPEEEEVNATAIQILRSLKSKSPIILRLVY